MYSNLQGNQKEQLQQKSFQEIWKILTPSEQADVRYELMSKIRCTMQTVRNYANGRTRPSYPVMKEVASVVSKVTGTKCHPNYLFP